VTGSLHAPFAVSRGSWGFGVVSEQPYNVVYAWAPSDRETRISLYAPKGLLRGMLDDGWNAKFGQYAGLIHGYGQSEGLLGAHHLYRGLNRPHSGWLRDGMIYAYVISPSITYTYPEDRRYTGEGPLADEPPPDSVFVVYADIPDDPGLISKHLPDVLQEAGVRGILCDWEWIKADPTNPSLPEDHAARYGGPVWTS
jgi:hypothetical protein